MNIGRLMRSTTERLQIFVPSETFRAQWKLRYSGRLHGWSNQNCKCGVSQRLGCWGFLLEPKSLRIKSIECIGRIYKLTGGDLSDAHVSQIYKQAHSIGDTVVWTGEGVLLTGRTGISAYLWTIKTVVIPQYGSCQMFFLSCRLPFLFLFKIFACERVSLSPIIGIPSSIWRIVIHT